MGEPSSKLPTTTPEVAKYSATFLHSPGFAQHSTSGTLRTGNWARIPPSLRVNSSSLPSLPRGTEFNSSWNYVESLTFPRTTALNWYYISVSSFATVSTGSSPRRFNSSACIIPGDFSFSRSETSGWFWQCAVWHEREVLLMLS